MVNVNSHVVSYGVSVESLRVAACICAGNGSKKFPKLPTMMHSQVAKVLAVPVSATDKLVHDYHASKRG